MNGLCNSFSLAASCLLIMSAAPQAARGNPWNGKVVLQAFWWDAHNEDYAHNWYTYLAKLAPRLRQFGFDGIWIPPPCGKRGNPALSQ